MAYPTFYKDIASEEADSIISLWHELLGDCEALAVTMAVKKLILESQYPPTIADVRRRIADMQNPNDITAAEAWGEVEKAIRAYGYYREGEALASMTPRTRKIVQYIGWQEICTCEEPGVTRGQFLKMYGQVLNRDKQDALLPQALKEQIKTISENMSLKLIEGGIGDVEVSQESVGTA